MNMPLRRLAANLSLILSPASSRSNCANESRMLSVSRPIEVVVQNDCVTERNAVPLEHVDQLGENR
jgi:hypothetical protein